MTETKWTPGPWALLNGNSIWEMIADDTRGDFVCDIACPYYDQRAEANAHLIAAAPELYEVLMTLRDYLSDIAESHLWAGDGDKITRIHSKTINEDLSRIDAALAKARGEQ